MNHTASGRATTRRLSRALVACLLVVLAAISVAVGQDVLASSTSQAASPIGLVRLDHGAPRLQPRGALGEADGVVRGRVTVFDEKSRAVTRLDPALRAALRRAATDAADEGVELHVNSGWRSANYQDQLLREAVAKYGSTREATRWVATAKTSPHVAGDAVDLGGSDATAWLSGHGAAYGLCQIYRNEPWHYELRPSAVNGGCPATYADPTHDPRMQK